MNRLSEWSKSSGGSLRNQGSSAKEDGVLQKKESFAKGNGVLQKRESFAEQLVMFCQRAVVFAAMVCFIIIWGGLVIVAQSETLSDLIKNGFRKGLLLTGQADGIVRAVMLIVTAVLVLVLLGAVFRHVSRAGKRRLYIDSAVLLVLMIAIYVFFLTHLRIIPTTDARSITDQAYTLAKTGAQSMDADSVYANYFSKYSNNYPFALFLVGYFRILLAIGVTDIWLPLYLLNMTGLLLGALFTWLTARKVLGLRAAVKVQLLMTLCPVYYLMMFWVYTTTLSVPFVTGMIYLAFCIRDVVIGKTRDLTTGKSRDVVMEKSDGEAKDKPGNAALDENKFVKRKIIDWNRWCKLAVLSVLEGLLCSLGFLLRATNAIVVIAIVICILLCIIRRDKKKNQDIFIRAIAACLFATIVAAGSYVSIHSYCMDYFAAVSDGNYPITHWLMMGSHDNGMYNVEDDRFTFHLETAEEKKEATWAQTVENYRKAGVVGTLKLIGKKMIINWSDGYFAMDLRLEQNMKYSPVYTWIAGNHNDAFHLYCQGCWLAVGVLIIVACVRLLRGNRTSKKHGDLSISVHDNQSLSASCDQIITAPCDLAMPMLPFLLVLTLFGAIVFYWFWEVKPAYALPFLYVFYLLAVCGQESDGRKEKAENDELEIERQKMLSSGKRWLLRYIVIIFLALEYLYCDTVSSGKPYYDYSIRCAKKNWLIQIAMEDGDTITQEFYPNSDFNRITLSVVAVESETESEVEKGGESETEPETETVSKSGNDSEGDGTESDGASASAKRGNSSGGAATCLHVTLQDAEGNVVYAGMITKEDINSENKVTLKVGEQSADSKGGYLLSITKETGSFGNLNLRTRKGISLNAYKGDLNINGVLQGTDLYMQVYRLC